jgi:tRNA (pseudouridine54-N1)-methyltransferase
MRRFLVLAHRVPVSGNFTLNDLAGGAGRMDEVARVVSTAFTLSNDLRRDVELTILFTQEPAPAARRIRLIGDRLRYLNPDERSTAALLKNALVRSLAVDREIESSPGLLVAAADPPAELERFLRLPGAFWLNEAGSPIRSFLGDGSGFAAVISDDRDLTEAEAASVRASGIPCLSVGPRSLRSSQCIDVVHNEFDLREAERPVPGP